MEIGGEYMQQFPFRSVTTTGLFPVSGRWSEQTDAIVLLPLSLHPLPLSKGCSSSAYITRTEREELETLGWFGPTDFIHRTPEGRPGMSDVSPLSGISGLSFDSTLLSPLLFFCLVLLPFLFYRFLLAGPLF